jgi:hypothetical protein
MAGEYHGDLLCNVLENIESDDWRFNITIDPRLLNVIGEMTVSGEITSEMPGDVDNFLDNILWPIGLIVEKREPSEGLLRDYYITGNYNEISAVRHP